MAEQKTSKKKTPVKNTKTPANKTKQKDQQTDFLAMDANDYFAYVKSRKHEVTDDFLKKFQGLIEAEMSKALEINQNYVLKRLAFTYSVIPKEYELLKHKINVYVLGEDVKYYMTSVADKAVKITDLETYPRPIPNEVVERLMEIRKLNLFDKFYIVFTDYTDEVTRKVEEERKRKDPIIFGCFEKQIDGGFDIHDRWYFIADWEDEYCDLTLTKLVDDLSKKGKENVLKPVGIKDATYDDVIGYLGALREQEKNDRAFNFNPVKAPKKEKKITLWWESLWGRR